MPRGSISGWSTRARGRYTRRSSHIGLPLHSSRILSGGGQSRSAAGALGQTDAALQAWHQALQADEARTALLNQRARLLEQLGQLADAEQTLRASLLTDPRQPDAIQHWVHVRQKMCQWPVLADAIPGLARRGSAAQCGPLAALALTDKVGVQSAIAAQLDRAQDLAGARAAQPAAGLPARAHPARLHVVGFLPARDELPHRRTVRAA